MRPSKKIGKEKADYISAYMYSALALVGSLSNHDESDWGIAFEENLDAMLDLESYVIGDDNIKTLQYSNHACAAIVNGTAPRDKDINNDSRHAFPFQKFAYDAMREDIRDAAIKILKEKGIDINAPEYNGENDTEEEETVVGEREDVFSDYEGPEKD